MNRDTAWRMLVGILFDREDQSPNMLQKTAEENALWRLIIQFSDAHLITPAVWTALQGRAIPHQPDDVRQYLWAVHELNVNRNRELLAQLDEAILLLNRVGVVPVLLKGAAYLKANVFSDAGARMLSDIDLWVEPSALPRAVQALRSSGYREAETPTDFMRHHHLCPMIRPQGVAAIELHHQLLPRDMSPAFPEDILLRSVTTEKNGNLSFGLLSPEHMLILSFLHSQVVDGFHRTFTIGLRPLLDLKSLTSRYADDIDLHRVACLLRTYGFDKPFRDYLHEAARVGAVRSQPRVRLDEWIHYVIARARIRWSSVDRLSLHEFTSEWIRTRLGRRQNIWDVNRYRLQIIGTLFRRFLYGQ